MSVTYFHLHLVSDSTGETLIAAGRAATAQFDQAGPIEHIYPLIRTRTQLERALQAIENEPGIVLYTLVNEEFSKAIDEKCRILGCPCLSVLSPVINLFQSYLGMATTFTPGAQHVLNADYFKRIDAMNFTMLHDDGQHLDTINEADVILTGISRTSKTPTSVYLANRGIKTANVPLVPNVAPPEQLEKAKDPLIVGLVASTERIAQIRQNRLLSLKAEVGDDAYTDEEAIQEEILFSRRFCTRHGWPLLDVTRRSIEETAASIVKMLGEHRERNTL
jgi:[pyruvate, water dikinase]-phosphate phosphotransferase / [pyruvate, water dikinase] kinase